MGNWELGGVLLGAACVLALALLGFAVTPLIAARKGFTWYWWLFAGSYLGLFIVAVLPAANKPWLPPEEAERRRQKAFRAGSGFSALFLGSIMLAIVSAILAELDQLAHVAGPGGPAQSVWESRFHPVRVAYGPPWKLAEISRDTDEGTVVGFHDESRGMSYMITVVPDLLDPDVTEEYFAHRVKRNTLGPDPANALIDEAECRFHGATWRRMRFVLRNEQGIKLWCHMHVRAEGRTWIGVVWMFPYDEDLVSSGRIPPELAALDRNVRLFEGTIRP